jgi:2,5-furandicarboxylate decarboxylase 1
MAKDLRSYLDEISLNDPKQLIRVQKEISCKYEVIALSDLFEQKKKFPMFLYENVLNVKGKPGNRVLVNLYGDRARYPIAFGLPKEEQRMAPVRAFIEGMQKPIPPIVVGFREAPVKEVIHHRSELDLQDLPIVHHHQEDGGFYFTQPFLTKDPDTGIYNLSFHRAMNLGKDENAIFLAPTHSFDNFNKYKSQGKPCPIVHVNGHHPLMGWAASTRVPKNYSEIDLTGGLLGEPVRMVPSETWGEDFLVPADAEIVVEGEIVLDKTVMNEGPFGEWTGYMGSSKEANLMKVRSITRRRDAILVTEPMGQCGLYGISGFPNEALYFQMAEQISPHVKAIHFPRSGNGFASCYLSFAKQGPLSEGDQKNIAVHLCFGYVKLIVVTDEDVDVFDEEEIIRAVLLRCQASLDIDIVRGIRGSLLDPSMVHPTTHDVMIIDATWKLNRRIPIKASLLPEILNRFRIEDYEAKNK